MKKLLSLAITLSLTLTLSACGAPTVPSGSSGSSTPDRSSVGSGADVSTPAEPVVLNVAASATPHAEILEQIAPIMAE